MGWVKPVILWWNKNKSFLKVFLFGAGSVGLCLLALMFSGPLISKYVFCTQGACLYNTIGVELLGVPEATPYNVIFYFPKEETKSVSCIFGFENVEKGCNKDGAFVVMAPGDEAPEDFSITVVFNEKRISQDFHPVYWGSRPIGSSCLPTCYRETVRLTIPDDFFGE